jgi:hypothetical protein
MTPMDEHPLSATLDEADESERLAAVARLHDLFVGGELSVERFSLCLDGIYAAVDRGDLEAAMVALPPVVPLTPAARQLPAPLTLRTPDGRLRLGAGWQLAARTTVSTGFGAALLDLTAASWDSRQVDLHLETWGSIEVLVPKGASVQLLGGSGCVRLDPLSAPVPGGPVLRISTGGPTGIVTIRHPRESKGGPMARRRRSREVRRAVRRSESLARDATVRATKHPRGFASWLR